jgi:DNA-binding LacI/PurR family transcriptional regulator
LNVHTLNAHATIRSGREVFDRLLKRHPEVTAVLGMNEQALVGVMEAAAAAGVRVPQDLSVISLGVSAATAEMTTPSLTTVSPPAQDLGALSIGQLIDVLHGRATGPAQLLVQPVLHERASTGPARARH